MTDVTRLLEQYRGGDRAALDTLMPLVHRELHNLASGYLRSQAPGHTLQPTALINEAYIRLAERGSRVWQDRAHFVAVAATVMRQILVDHARSRNRIKRGSGADKVALDEGIQYNDERSGELLALDDALGSLSKFDERKAKVLELRFFGGLSTEETAEALGVSVATVGREARLAQAWLVREMRGLAQ